MKLGLVAACIVLALSIVSAFPVFGYLAYVKYGVAGLKTAGVAASVCWLPATAALVITGFVKRSPHAVAGIVVANGVRFGVPLVAGFALQGASATLAKTGIFGLVVAFYLLTLAVGTALSVLLDRQQSHGDGKGIVTNG